MYDDEWKRELRNSFGEIDRKFAIHQLDRNHAIEMMRFASLAHATLDNILDEARAFLIADGCGEKHVAEQLEAIRRFYRGRN